MVDYYNLIGFMYERQLVENEVPADYEIETVDSSPEKQTGKDIRAKGHKKLMGLVIKMGPGGLPEIRIRQFLKNFMPLLNARYPCTDDQSESFTTTNKEFRIKMNHR